MCIMHSRHGRKVGAPLPMSREPWGTDPLLGNRCRRAEYMHSCEDYAPKQRILTREWLPSSVVLPSWKLNSSCGNVTRDVNRLLTLRVERLIH